MAAKWRISVGPAVETAPTSVTAHELCGRAPAPPDDAKASITSQDSGRRTSSQGNRVRAVLLRCTRRSDRGAKAAGWVFSTYPSDLYERTGRGVLPLSVRLLKMEE